MGSRRRQYEREEEGEKCSFRQDSTEGGRRGKAVFHWEFAPV